MPLWICLHFWVGLLYGYFCVIDFQFSRVICPGIKLLGHLVTVNFLKKSATLFSKQFKVKKKEFLHWSYTDKCIGMMFFIISSHLLLYRLWWCSLFSLIHLCLFKIFLLILFMNFVSFVSLKSTFGFFNPSFHSIILSFHYIPFLFWLFSSLFDYWLNFSNFLSR